jgi:hypothetical protein
MGPSFKHKKGEYDEKTHFSAVLLCNHIFPLAESSAVEDYYLVPDRGPLWPLEGPKLEMPFPLSHSAPFFPYLAEEYYWSDLPSGDVGPETQDIHSHLFGASGGTQKSSAIFQKNGAELITLKHRYILFPQIEQVASLSGYAGFSNQEDQTLYPQKEIKRIRAP